jgi:hypothetical protein
MPLTRRRLAALALMAAAAPQQAAAQFIGREDGTEPPPAGARPSPGVVVPPLRPGAEAFAPGETLHYSVAFEGITAGQAKLVVVGPSTIEGRDGLLVRYTGETRGIARRIYRFEDRIDALLEPPGFFTHRYESWSLQRNRRRHRIVTFEPEAGRFVRREESGSVMTGAIAGEVVDGLGLVYHLRARPLASGGQVTVPLYRKQGVTRVTFGVTGPETIDTPAGRFQALRVRPVRTESSSEGNATSDGGLFGGSGSMWFTSDPRRLPVRLVGSARYGSIEARLTQLDLPRD